MKELYIIGAGGFGRETAWLVERINRAAPAWELKGFIDDDQGKCGTLEGGYPVIGGCGRLEGCGEVWAVCAVASTAARRSIIERVGRYGNVRFATLIDPDAILSPTCTVGEGGIICAGTVLTVDVTIGRHAIVNWACTVGHDTVLEDFVTLYPGANVSGNVVVGCGAELGTGAQVIQGRRVGRCAVVGAGAVVVRDLPCGCTAVGVPARPIKGRACRVTEP